MARKIQVNFDDEALKVLDCLKDTTKSNYGEVIRNALGLYEWARREYAQGHSIGTIENGRAVREVVLPQFETLKYAQASGSQSGREKARSYNQHMVPNPNS